jgi:hypothetical protein
MTEAGNHFVAEEIAAQIQRRRLLPRAARSSAP